MTAQSGASARPAILVVDDDDLVRQVVRRTLEAEFAVSTAESGYQALEFLDGGTEYVAVVCDLSMPKLGGLELLKLIKERDSDLPVIILTGQATLESAMEVIQYGGFRYLTKPFESEDLTDAVQSASASRQLEVLRRRAVEICDSGAWRIASSENLDEHFDEALQNVWMAYQPIFEASGTEIYGYEALIRSRGPQLTNPGLLFDAAERLGRVRDVGRIVRSLAAKDIHTAPEDSHIFVNLHALELGDAELYSSAAPLSKCAERVILEITERASLDLVSDLRERLQKLRKLGYRIAVDDLGAGYAGLASFSQLAPDVAKLDMSLIRGVDTDPRKASIVGSILQVCQRDLDTRVVCEGVETKEELERLGALGADLLQGFYLARPSPFFEGAIRKEINS